MGSNKGSFLQNATSGAVLARRARIANGLREQFWGWMGRADVESDEALGIPHCAAIHTFFVRVPVDAAFCDKSGRVLEIVRNIAPFRVTRRVSGASLVWEMRAGGPLSDAVSPGDALTLSRAEAKE